MPNITWKSLGSPNYDNCILVALHMSRNKMKDTLWWIFMQQHIVILNSTVFSFHFPELRSSSCGNPGIPPKGILNGTRFNLGDKIRYRCVTGYVLDGHSLLTCVTNAAGVSVWDFPVPICRGEDVLTLKLSY